MIVKWWLITLSFQFKPISILNYFGSIKLITIRFSLIHSKYFHLSNLCSYRRTHLQNISMLQLNGLFQTIIVCVYGITSFQDSFETIF